MLALIGILLLLGVALAVFLWAGTLFLQGYIYSEPVANISWRAPVAGVILAAFAALWVWLDYRNPGQFPGQLFFSTGEDKQFPELWAVQQGRENHYVLRKTSRGLPNYVDKASGLPLDRQGTPEAIIVVDNDERIRFEAERDAKGYFVKHPGKPLIYRDSRGRQMLGDRPGQLTVRRWGLFLANVLLNLAHLAVWFASLWLVLRFQWTHALAVAVVLWLVMTFFIQPMILSKAEDVARQRAAGQTAGVSTDRGEVAVSPATASNFAGTRDCTALLRSV